MKILLTSILLTLSLTANANEYLVWHFSNDVRIVLSQTACKDDSKGKEAAAQRIDGNYLSGCWVKEPNDLVKIFWKSGDFSEFPMKNFTKVNQ